MKKLLALVLVLISVICVIPVNNVLANKQPETIQTITTGESTDLDYEETWTFSFTPEYTESNPIAVSLKKGAIYCIPMVVSENEYAVDSLDVYIYSDIELNDLVGRYGLDNYVGKTVAIPETGTYYMVYVLDRAYGYENETIIAADLPYQVSSENRWIQSKVYSVAYSDSTSEDVYFKFKVSRPATVEFEISGGEDGYSKGFYATLCDAKKKPVSDESYVSQAADEATAETITYAVDKGTYYIKVNTYAGVFRVKATIAAFTKTGASTQAKATALTLNKTTKGIFTPSMDGLWYKFTLKKSSNITILITGKMGSSTKFEIYEGKDYIDSCVLYSGEDSAELESIGKFPAGTYYIKVTDRDNVANAKFAIKVSK